MTGHPRRGYSRVHDTSSVDLAELCSFAYHGATLADAGGVLADGLDCAYANPGTEACYGKPGFPRMNTALAIWNDPARAVNAGLLSAQPPT